MANKNKNTYPVNKKAKIKPSLNGFLGLVAFTTKIPISRFVTIEEMVGSVFLLQYTGIIIGIAGALVAYVLASLLGFNSILTAAIVYCFLIWFTGFNHVDGVMDMGDGLMVHGEPEKRMRVMRDSMVGTGGIASFFIVALLTVASLSSIPPQYLLASIVLMELCAKLGQATSMVFGSSDKEGIGTVMREGIDYKVLLVNSIVDMIIAYLLLGSIGVIVVLASIISGLYISYVAQKNFGCVSGDVFGAANEITRVVALLIIILNLNIL